MIRIAVCDDDRNELERAAKLIKNYSEENTHTDFDIRLFSDPVKLNDSISENGCFDILFLDIYMPGMKGTELAAELRGRNEKCEIIFTTSSGDHAVEAYRLNAIQYLVKPYSSEELNGALRRALTQISNSSPGYIVIDTSDGARRLGLHEIVNSYAIGHYQVVRISGGEELRRRCTADELYGMLQQTGRFIRVGSPYIINVWHVTEVRPKDILLDDGTCIPLPKNSYKTVKKQYIDLMFAGNEATGL